MQLEFSCNIYRQRGHDETDVCNMARLELEIAAFKSCSGPYPWRDFARLLGQLGYELKKGSKTGGSRRKYYNAKTGHLIVLDEPHDREMRRGMVKRLQQELQDKGVI